MIYAVASRPNVRADNPRGIVSAHGNFARLHRTCRNYPRTSNTDLVHQPELVRGGDSDPGRREVLVDELLIVVSSHLYTLVSVPIIQTEAEALLAMDTAEPGCLYHDTSTADAVCHPRTASIVEPKNLIFIWYSPLTFSRSRLINGEHGSKTGQAGIRIFLRIIFLKQQLDGVLRESRVEILQVVSGYSSPAVSPAAAPGARRSRNQSFA